VSSIRPHGDGRARLRVVAARSGDAPEAAATAGAALFALRDIDVRYGRVPALAGVTLSIHAGERVALIGANGSGKSTLLRVLHGLLPHARGAFVNAVPPQAQAMLFQRPHMLRMSVRNNVALALWLQGARWRDAQREAVTALGRVGLAEVAGRNARTLSGGQQQRMALARAWALKPAVLLLDEPTASLDPTAKREVEALIADAAQGRTLVFASHNLGQVKRLASRVVYLEHGRVLADLPVHDFFNGPLPEEARQFVKGELA
jgi:tungstate transport system ATP-binding protein